MLGSLATLGAGMISSAGQVYANQQMLDQQQRNNDISVGLANTAHQREVLDLLAAGINPVLTAGGSGSAVPQLGVAEQGNPLAGIAEGASSAARMATLEVPKVESQIEVNSAQAQNLRNQGELYRVQAEAVRRGAGFLGLSGDGDDPSSARSLKDYAESLGDRVGSWLGEHSVEPVEKKTSTAPVSQARPMTEDEKLKRKQRWDETHPRRKLKRR